MKWFNGTKPTVTFFGHDLWNEWIAWGNDDTQNSLEENFDKSDDHNTRNNRSVKKIKFWITLQRQKNKILPG